LRTRVPVRGLIINPFVHRFEFNVKWTFYCLASRFRCNPASARETVPVGELTHDGHANLSKSLGRRSARRMQA
jgi:hypothetical protein